MAFETMKKKNFGNKLKNNQISVSSNIISFGEDIAKEFHKGDYVLIRIDYESKQIGILKSSKAYFDSYIISRDESRTNSSPHITCKRLCKMIPRKRYKAFKVREMWIFNVTEIVDDRKVAI